MKVNELKRRLRKDRAMTTVSLTMPKDVVEDLKRTAPRLGFYGYESLIRAYVGQGLRVHLERFEAAPEMSHLIESLQRRGVPDEVIASAVAEAKERVEAA